MGNAVTVPAFVKLLMDHCTVGRAMAVLTFRQLAVLRVALCTAKSGMLCLIILQQVVGLLMTSGADFLGLL